MQPLTDRKIILITRRTRLAELVVRYNTVTQARFYVEHLGADFSDYLREDEQYHHAITGAEEILRTLGRVQVIDRGFLTNFVFGPEDLVVAIGQDGLVANTLKYLSGQFLVGVNPDPGRWDGKLLPFTVPDLAKIIPEVILGRRPTRSVTMAKAVLNNGQSLHAVNDFFIGPRSHISIRYTIGIDGRSEEQSSSGVIVSTGLGSSGWLKSLLTGAMGIAQNVNEDGMRRRHKIAGPKNGTPAKSEFPWDADHLCFTVREPFPSRTTSTSLVFGRVTPQNPLTLISHMAENGVIFSDGMEKDFLEFNSGARVAIGLAERKGILVI